MTEHGTRTCYAQGCRRVECVEANAEYQRLWRASPSGITRQRQQKMRAQQKRAQKWRDQAAASAD